MPSGLLVPDSDMRFMDAMGEFAHAGTDNHIRQQLIRAIPKEVLSEDGNIEKVDREAEKAKLQTFSSLELEAELTRISYGRSYYDVMSGEAVDRMRELAPIDVHDDIRLVFLGNLLVENGHAEYDRVISKIFQHHPGFRRWKDLWVAEEKTHGDAMEKWAWLANFLDMQEVHALTQGYLRNGLTLDFATAAHGLAYPSFQEKATEDTHRDVTNEIPANKEEYFAGFVGRQMMGLVIGNEIAHKIFYTTMVRHALETGDPEIVSQMMIAVRDAALGIAMPGMESDIPGREEIMKAYRRTGIFTAGKLAMNVLVPALDADQDIYGWKIQDRTELTDEAKEAQSNVIDFTARLKEAAGEDRKSLIVIGKARKEFGRVA